MVYLPQNNGIKLSVKKYSSVVAVMYCTQEHTKIFPDSNGRIRGAKEKTDHVACMFEEVHKQLLKRKYVVQT